MGKVIQKIPRGRGVLEEDVPLEVRKAAGYGDGNEYIWQIPSAGGEWKGMYTEGFEEEFGGYGKRWLGRKGGQLIKAIWL